MTNNDSLWNFTEIQTLGKNTTLVRNNFNGALMTLCAAEAGAYEIYRRIAGLNSPNLMRVYDVRVTGDRCMSLCEYIEGITIEEAVQLHYFNTEAQVASAMAQLCDGLTALHGVGIVHRDINPSNVMLDKNYVVKIIDYDIIRTVKDAKGRDTRVMGTPGFAAPEQFGFSQTDRRADIYSCGVLINYIMTGTLPNERFCGGNLGYIVRQCIEMDADNRFSTAAELKKALTGNRRKPYRKGVKEHVNYRKLPGFRGNKRSVKILAGTLIVFYFLCVWTNIDCVLRFPRDAARYHYNGVIFFGFLSAVPYVCFGDLFGISRLFSKKNPFLGKKILKAIGISSLIIGAVMIVLAPRLIH